jgi:hypothetical protein
MNELEKAASFVGLDPSRCIELQRVARDIQLRLRRPEHAIE